MTKSSAIHQQSKMRNMEIIQKMLKRELNAQINKVRYIILKKIMYSLFKICKKKNDDVINKNKNK